MAHSEVYPNKYVVSIAPFSTPACPDCSQNIQKAALFCMFSLFNFSSIFPGGSADPICPYVRTPMAVHSRRSVDSIGGSVTVGGDRNTGRVSFLLSLGLDWRMGGPLPQRGPGWYTRNFKGFLVDILHFGAF